jgi:hypothetical protein
LDNLRSGKRRNEMDNKKIIINQKEAINNIIQKLRNRKTKGKYQ